MFMHDHVQVTLLSTEIWLWKGPFCQSPKSAIWRPYWIGPKFYMTCIKVLSQVITVPNMNEIHSFVSEKGPRNGFHTLRIWKTKSAIWRPYWIGPKFYSTCIKVLSQVITVPNMNEIPSFMSENGPRNGFHMLSIWKMKLATWRPSWTKNSKRGYVHQ